MKELAKKAALWLLGAIGIGGVLILAGWVAFVALTAILKKDEQVGAHVEAQPAPEVKKAPKKKVTVKAPVTVYRGGVARLKLPPEAQTPNTEVIAATQVRGSDRPQIVTTTIDTDTGESQTFTRLDPYPWFAIETRGEARLAIGMKLRDGRAEQVVRMGVGYDVVRVKALTAGVQGTLDSDGEGFIGLSVAYRW
jgi:hypothetical protein